MTPSFATTAASEAAVTLLAAALPLSIAGANIGWGLVLASLLAAAAAGERFDLGKARTPALAPLAACLAAGALSAALSSAPRWGALQGDAHRLWLAALFAVAFSGLAHSGRLRAMAAFGMGAGLAAAVGLGQALAARLQAGAWQRAHAFVHPVTFGELMCFAALAAAALLASPEDARSPRARAWLWGALAWSGAALVLSGTRGAVLGLGAGLLAGGLAAPGLRLKALGAIPLAAASFAAADRLPQDSRRSLWPDAAAALGGAPAAGGSQMFRLTLWSAALDMFRERPLLGVGPGAFRDEYPRFASIGIDGQRGAGTAHNLFLHHLAERGLVGLAALLALFAALGSTAARRAARRPDAPALWALGSTAAFLVMNCTETAMQTEQVWMSFFFIWLLAATDPPQARSIVSVDGAWGGKK